MKTAFIFPGQGSQLVGMGKDFYDQFPVCRNLFEQINDSLGYKLSEIVFNGPIEELTRTVNTQPALMAVSMTVILALQERTGKEINQLCDITAGHSLGEYSALCATGSINLTDTTKLLKIRGQSMQEACPEGEGTMAACLGIDITKLENILMTATNEIQNKLVCEIANDNIDGQVIISGHVDLIDRVISILKDTGYKAIKLNVSAPFHCSLIKQAERIMEQNLAPITVKSPLVPVVSNYSAIPSKDPTNIKSNLVQQICHRVRWRETLDYFTENGVTNIVEIGAGRVLTNMLKRSSKYRFNLYNIGNIEELKDYLTKLF